MRQVHGSRELQDDRIRCGGRCTVLLRRLKSAMVAATRCLCTSTVLEGTNTQDIPRSTSPGIIQLALRIIRITLVLRTTSHGLSWNHCTGMTRGQASLDLAAARCRGVC